MGDLTKGTAVVPPEEVERRIAEYRRLSFQRRAPAQVVYHGPMVSCPWPGCGCRIAGINFQLDNMGDQEFVSRALASWWNGPGLVGTCPSCKRPVLFDVPGKQAVIYSAQLEAVILPEDWDQKALLVIKPSFSQV